MCSKLYFQSKIFSPIVPKIANKNQEIISFKETLVYRDRKAELIVIFGIGFVSGKNSFTPYS
jgi:hypothetical protein